MERNANDSEHRLERLPKLVPAGSVNRLLLIGGKNLTMFQWVGLIVIGVLVAFGVGGSFLATEFGFPARTADHADAFYLILFAFAMVLWGLAMIGNGVVGVARRLRKSTGSAL